MKENHKLTISKLEAARSQLETAIKLYFDNGEPVSIHTLSSAAYNIIQDINRQRGRPPMFAKEGFLVAIKLGYEKQVHALIYAAENFFKHADRDHEATLEFDPRQTELLLLDACGTFYKLTGEFPPLFKVFQAWFVANNQQVFKFPEAERVAIAKAAPAQLALGRSRFYKLILEEVTRRDA